MKKRFETWLDNSWVADPGPYSQIGPMDPLATLPAFLSGEHPGQWCFYYEKAASIIQASDKARACPCLQWHRGAAYPPLNDFNQVNQLLCQAN